MDQIISNWQTLIDALEKEFPAVSFDLWVRPLKPLLFKNGNITIEAPNAAAKTFIIKNYLNVFDNTLKEVFGDEYQSFKLLDTEEAIDFKNNIKEDSNETLKHLVNLEPIKEQSEFNKKYTFDGFVVGNCNQFVYAASRAVAENPGTKFNPLFIYGGVGLGKTHLLHAIGNEIEKNNPNKIVCYVTCEKFTNDYIESLRTNQINKFRNKYRNVDILLIDDIQFLVKKLSTQEEFFHTFNDLYQYNKQIVLTSDRNPKELTELEDRLKSRFQSGLIQDLQSPDYETRLAILEKKVEIEQYKVNHDALVLIAERVDTNIRELEGILQKVCFHSTLMSKTEADVLDVMDSLNEKIETDKSALTLDKICEIVADYYNISLDNLKSKKRSKEFVEPRQMAIYLICEFLPDVPLASIGMFFNGRDHTTIIHSRDKVEQNIKAYTKIKNQFNDLKTIIYRL